MFATEGVTNDEYKAILVGNGHTRRGGERDPGWSRLAGRAPAEVAVLRLPRPPVLILYGAGSRSQSGMPDGTEGNSLARR
jgi:hypothetical protein